MDLFEQLCKEILSHITDVKSYDDLNRLKQRIVNSTRYHGLKVPSNIELYLYANNNQKKLLKKIAPIKPVRELSGVHVIAIMTKPYPCPHIRGGIGPCLMCPGGQGSYFGDVPQSYTGKEPATMRAIRNNYDPYLQVMNRLEQYVVTGKIPQKIELIIMGGTFPSMPRSYQSSFILNAIKAMNDFSRLFYRGESFMLEKFKRFFLLPGKVDDKSRIRIIKAKLKAMKSRIADTNKSRHNIINYNDKHSKVKCIGITVETRPDQASLDQLNFLLSLGVTRIEIGLQTIYDHALKILRRGHTTQHSIESIRRAKDLGFKINLHVMLNIPGLSPKQELMGLRELFTNPDFRPDMLKIYPLYVIKGTRLYEWYKHGKYKPYDFKTLRDIIVKFKTSIVPRYCRIMRIQRDIPTTVIEAGVKISNLRQIILDYMHRHNLKCNCIRCREVGRHAKPIKNIKLNIISYEASRGKEFFISYDDVDNDTLIGFVRMRYPSQSLRVEITPNTALIRELHVYGDVALLGKPGKTQHRGFGKRLLAEAEKIAKHDGKDKVVIISGIGVREYYRKLGYRKQGPYMVKNL